MESGRALELHGSFVSPGSRAYIPRAVGGVERASLENAVLIGQRLSASVQLDVGVMEIVLRRLPAPAQKGLARVRRIQKLVLGAAHVVVAKRERLVVADVVRFVSEVADVAVRAVGARAVRARAVGTGGNPKGQFPFPMPSRFSPDGLQAAMQMHGGSVSFGVGVEQHARGGFVLQKLLRVQGGAARRNRRQAGHVILARAVRVAQNGFPRTKRIRMAVAVRVAVHVDFGPAVCVTSLVIRASSGTARAPAVPHVVAFRAVVNEYEQPERDGKRPVKAAEDHIQKVTLCYRQSAERPRGDKQKQREGGGPQLSLERVLVGQHRGVDQTRAAPVALAAVSPRLPLVDVSQPLLLLAHGLQLVLPLGVFAQLDEGAQEVDAGHQDDEGHGPIERT